MAENSDLRELGESLHNRLLAGNDIRAGAEISEKFFPLLVEALERKFSRVIPDTHLIVVSAEDALLDYLNQPEKFAPKKRSLIGYLYMAGYRNVIDKIRGSKENFVVFDPLNPEHNSEGERGYEDPEQVLIRQEGSRLSPTSPVMRRALSILKDEIDLKVAELMINGVRDTEDYAEIMKIKNLSIEEQRAQVNQRKDTVKKKLKRGLRPSVREDHES